MTTKLLLAEIQSGYVKTFMYPFSSTNSIFYLNIFQYDGKGAACVSTLRFIMSEMNKWFDVHFANSKISKAIHNLFLCLSLTYLMFDVFNVLIR